MNNELIEELHDKLKRGATPARLIRHILSKHQGESVTHWVIRDYLMAAFAVPVGQYLPPGAGLFGLNTAQAAILTKALLPELIQRREQWDSHSESNLQSSSWLDGLHPISTEEAKKAAATTRCPGLSESSWDSLTSPEQESLRVLIASSQVLSQRVEILARLAECLQQQVDELERQLESTEG